jgi:hypothetical protein
MLYQPNVSVKGQFQVLRNTEELEAFNPRHCGPVDVNRGMISLLSPAVQDQLLCLVDIGGEVIFLAPLYQGTHLPPVGRLIVVGNQVCCGYSKLDD